MQINSAIGTITIISSDYKQAIRIESYIERLDNILEKNRGKHVLICADANATSTMWHSPETNDKGLLLEELILRHSLVVLNQDSVEGTHKSGTKIDVSLCTLQLSEYVKNWHIREDLTTSDHNLLLFEIHTRLSFVSKPRFNPAKVPWDRFNEQLSEKLIPGTTPEGLTTAIQDVMKNYTTTPKQFSRRPVPWWNQELAGKRRQLNKARRDFQRCCPCRVRLAKQGRYRRLLLDYKKAIHVAKQLAWEQFVVDSTTQDPFGLAYKIGSEKIKLKQVMTSLKKTDDQYTGSAEETLRYLVDQLVPVDTMEGETPMHAEVRENLAHQEARRGDRHVEPDFSMEELHKAIHKLRPRRAPGPDNIPSEVLKNLNQTNLTSLLEILNGCWRNGEFPKVWKHARIVIIRKAGDRDWTDPSSYRPISLLSVLGKTYERLVATRLIDAWEEDRKLDRYQFGFRRGRSTEDAGRQLLDLIDACSEKYIVGIFADIKGAFDSLWWPLIKQELQDEDVGWNTCSVTDDYMDDRTLEIWYGDLVVRRRVNRGCPQGSIFGPHFWNKAANKLLSLPLPPWAKKVGYADDIVILIEGRSRVDLERKLAEIFGPMFDWASLAKLSFSSSKTKAVWFYKAKMDPEGPPRFRIEGKQLKFSKEVDYLGIRLDENRNFIAHAKMVAAKGKTMMGKILQTARLRYGVPQATLSKLYSQVFLPIMTYGARIFAHNVEHSHVLRQLRAAQRAVLIGITGAYRTTSFGATTLLAAVPPLELEVVRRKKLWDIRHNLSDQSQIEMEGELLEMWQEEWDTRQKGSREAKGRHTHDIFPDVRLRLGMRHLVIDRTTSQFITGHGKFMTYFARMAITDHDTCECGLRDGPRHVLLFCPLLAEERTRLREVVQREELGWPPPTSSLFSNEAIFKETYRLCRVSHQLRIDRGWVP